VADRSLSIVFGTPTTDAVLVELGGDAEGVLAADRDERVDPCSARLALIRLDAALDLERVGARGAEDGAAAGQDAAHLGMSSGRCRPPAGPSSRPGSRRTRSRTPDALADDPG
jgi:hypothetical protein